ETLDSLLHVRFLRVSEFAVSPSTMAVAAFAVAVVVFVHVVAFALRLDRLDPDERPARLRLATRRRLRSERPFARAASLACLVIVVLLLRWTESESFIYFQF